MKTLSQLESAVKSLTDKLAAVRGDIEALKAVEPPPVQYRPAEWPRDWGRTDAEFSDITSDTNVTDDGVWSSAKTIIGRHGESWVSLPGPLNSQRGTYANCRVPILPGDEYREPTLPADAGKECEFSDDGKAWNVGFLCIWDHQWVGLVQYIKRRFVFARIKREAKS